jgi:hypothetical protein
MKQPWDEWFGVGRRLGIELAIVLGLGLLQMALAGVARAQAVTTTTVQGTVYLANGQVGAGTVNVSWPGFTTATGASIAAGHTMVTIAPDGYLSVNLAPNLGSTPAGLYYSAVFQMSDGTASTQYWVVPAAAQASLAQVQSQLMPAAQAVQSVSKAYVDQSIAELTGSLLTASGGTLSGNLYLNGDPTVPLQAADKHYVDNSATTGLPLAGGSLTGPLMLSGDPAMPLQASDKNYVDTQVSTALPITGGVVTGALTAKQIGASYEVDQYPGTDFGAKLLACLASLSSSYGGTCDARNFAGTLAMGSNLTISTANATVLLPCATIATAAQVIVTAGTRNVTLRGCALRGASTVSGSQGGTVFLYSGTGAMVQVGDPTHAVDTMGFHIDDLVINTTAATGASAQGLVAFRTQEMDVQGLYLLGNSNQTGMTLDGTGNYTGGSFYGDQFGGFQTAVNAIGHQVANPATTDWMNASTFVRLHIDCPTSGGNPISGTYGINLQQGDGNTFTGGDVESCGTALHLGSNAQDNTIVGLRNENSTNQVVADAGSSYNSWMTGGTMFTGKLTDNGTRNSFLDSFHRTFNGMNGDWYGSQQDATVTNHWRLGIGTGNERGLQNEIQTDYGYRWVDGYTDATAGEQYYQVQDLFNNVPRLSIGQYNNGQSSTNNQTVMNAAGTGAVVLNGSNNAGTGGVVFGSGGATETTVATVDKAGNAQFNGTLQVAGVSTLLSTPTVKNQLDAEVDTVLWAGFTQSQKESLVYKDWNGNSQWYAEKDASNNWELNSALGGLDSFKAYQSTNSGDTYVNASNTSGTVRVNYEAGAGTAFKVYGGSSGSVYASFTGATSIAFPGLAASSGHNCVQIDNSGYITNTGSACGAGGGGVGSGNSGQIAYYTSTGTTIGGMSTVPVSAGGTGAATAAGALASLAGVPNSTTVNGHALSGNVTVSASDLSTGTLPHAQLPSLVNGDIPNNAGNTTGMSANVTGMVALGNGGTGATTAAAGAANIVNGNPIAPSSVSSSGIVQGAVVTATGALNGASANISGSIAAGAAMSAPNVMGGINGGLATLQNSLKQDARICIDVSITASSGAISSSCANFTTADNSRIAIIYPNTGVSTIYTSTPSRPGALPINTPGTGWNVNDRCAITQSGASGAVATVLTVSGGVPGIVALNGNGQNYAVANGVACTAILPSTGTGLSVNITVLGMSARSYTGALTVTNSTTATLTGTYAGINTTGSTMILGTDDGAAFNALVNTITANSSKGELSLGCKPIITTQTLIVTGGRSTQIAGCGMASGITAGLTAGGANGTPIIWAGASHPVTLAISNGVVTLTDPAGHGFYGSYCQNSNTVCFVNVEGTTQTALSGTFLIQGGGSMTNTMLTFNAPLAVSGSDSGYMPFNDVLRIQNCAGCVVRDLDIMGSDQPSTKPRALLDPTDSSTTGSKTTDAYDNYSNIFMGNLNAFGNLPGNQWQSTSTAMYGILADPNLIVDDRKSFYNIHVFSVDICFSAEQPQPTDWTFSGTIGCAFSGAGFALPNGDWWHVSGTFQALQNGADYMLGGGAHLDVAKHTEETDGPSRVYAPQVGGPGDQPGTSMLLEAISNTNGSAPGGTLSIDHGVYPPDAFAPTSISLPTYVIGGSFVGSGFCVFKAANGGGYGATLNLLVQSSGFSSISITNLGFGYSSEPTSWSYVSGSACSTSITTTGGLLTADMIWANALGVDTRFLDFTWGASGNLAEPIMIPTVDFTIVASQNTFLCRGCSGLAKQNFKLPTPGIGSANHFVYIENDAPNNNNGGVNGSPSHSVDIIAGNDSRTLSNFRQDFPATINDMSGYINVAQLGPPTNAYNFTCASGSTTYYYKITSVNAAGQETTPSSEFNTTAVCAGTVNTTNTISGNLYPVIGADHYNVYRSTAAGGSGSEGLALTLQANTFTGQVTLNSGTPNAFTDSTPDGSLGAAPPTTNATGWVNVPTGGGFSIGGQSIIGNVYLPTTKSVAGDLICAEAADPTIGALSITGVASTATTTTFTGPTASYFAAGQWVQAQGNGTAGYNGGPWQVTSTSGGTVVVASTSNPGAGTAGGTLSLYCVNQSTDGGGNYTSFETTYTFPGNTLGTSILSVKARPQFGVFSSSPASAVSVFQWQLNATPVWKSSGSTAIAPLAGAVGISGTYPLDLTVLCGYFCGANSAGSVSAISAAVPPFALGGTTAIVDVLAASVFPPIAITTSSAQTLSLLVNYKATGVKAGTYTSGGTITGTTGQTCTLASFNDSSTATATVALTGTNTIASATALTMTARGGGATAAPTSATLGSGTATCSGTATISTVLGGSAGNALLLYGLVLTP